MIQNAGPIAVLLIAAGIFFVGIAWGCFALGRLIQISIAANLVVAQEIASLRKSYPGIPPLKMDPFKTTPPEKTSEGAFYGYNEAEMADQEKISTIKERHKDEQGGLSDEALEAHLAAYGATER